MAQTVPRDNPVTITITKIRGTNKFEVRANKDWWKLSAGSSQSLRNLFDAMRRRPDIFHRDGLPRSQDLPNPKAFVIEKQREDLHLTDCEMVQVMQGLVKDYVYKGREITWKGGFVQCRTG